MSDIELYSERSRRERGELPDVFSSDEIPTKLRNQLLYIVVGLLGFVPEFQNYLGGYADSNATGGFGGGGLGGPGVHIGIPREVQMRQTQKLRQQESQMVYGRLYELICRTHGYRSLPYVRHGQCVPLDLVGFIENKASVEEVLDIVEAAHRFHSEDHPNDNVARESFEKEVNLRFRQNGVGFRMEGGQFLSVQSELIHQEIVRPALGLLSSKGYATANQEFLSAHSHYRHGRHKEALNDALKALESTIKVVAQKRNWPVPPTAPAKVLIEACFANKLIDATLQSHFGALRATIEGGVPSMRNKLSGHGDGVEAVQVPDYVVEYAINLCASAIVFLVRADHEMVENHN